MRPSPSVTASLPATWEGVCALASDPHLPAEVAQALLWSIEPWMPKASTPIDQRRRAWRELQQRILANPAATAEVLSKAIESTVGNHEDLHVLEPELAYALLRNPTLQVELLADPGYLGRLSASAFEMMMHCPELLDGWLVALQAGAEAAVTREQRRFDRFAKNLQDPVWVAAVQATVPWMRQCLPAARLDITYDYSQMPSGQLVGGPILSGWVRGGDRTVVQQVDEFRAGWRTIAPRAAHVLPVQVLDLNDGFVAYACRPDPPDSFLERWPVRSPQ